MSSMKILLLLLGLSLAPVTVRASRLVADDRQAQAISGKPDFCGDYDCPPFKLVKETDNYEIRSYAKEKWVTTTEKGHTFTVAYPVATAKLIKYFKGANDAGKTLNLTTPTGVFMKLDKDGKGTEKDYLFGYWLPEDLDVPKPTDETVQVIDYPASDRYVKVFGGFATEGSIVGHMKGLQDLLDKDDAKYINQGFYAAIYDPPQKLLNRHNEVMIFKSEDQTTSLHSEQ